MDRPTARRLGSPVYTGKPCVICGGTERDTARALCQPCTRAKAKAYLTANPEPPASKRERMTVWRNANADKIREQRRRRRARILGVTVADLTAIDQAAADTAERRKVEREASRIRAEERRDVRLKREAEKQKPVPITPRDARHQRKLKRRRLASEPGAATKDDELSLLALQTGRCAYCGDIGPLHLDHRQPISRAGTHERRNLQWLCVAHNQAKAAMPDAVFRRLKGIPTLTPWDVATGLLLQHLRLDP